MIITAPMNPREVEILDQREHEAVLESAVNREVQEGVLGRRKAGATRAARIAAFPPAFTLEVENAGAGRKRMMKLDDLARRWIAESRRMVGATSENEAGVYQCPP